MSLKRDKVCPQCEGRKLWHVERMTLPVPHIQSLALAASNERNRWTGRWHSRGEFESFICAKCGFTEWYATQLETLEADPENGLHYIDNEPKAGLR